MKKTGCEERSDGPQNSLWNRQIRTLGTGVIQYDLSWKMLRLKRRKCNKEEESKRRTEGRGECEINVSSRSTWKSKAVGQKVKVQDYSLIHIIALLYLERHLTGEKPELGRCLIITKVETYVTRDHSWVVKKVNFYLICIMPLGIFWILINNYEWWSFRKSVYTVIQFWMAFAIISVDHHVLCFCHMHINV